MLEKKCVLITGASSGIGKATAELLAKHQYRLILCGRNQAALEKLQNQLQKSTEVHTLVFDVRQQANIQNLIDNLPENWKKIDILINNAGNAHGLEPLSDGNIDDWDAMIDINVKGLLYISKAIIPIMKAQFSGHIVNISSTAAKQTYANGVVYCASKKAVESISEGMRLELTEFGIKITNVSPGAVNTNFSNIRFKGDKERADKVYEGFDALQAEDIANAIYYCISAPKHVSIAEICLYPTAQSSPTQIYRKN